MAWFGVCGGSAGARDLTSTKPRLTLSPRHRVPRVDVVRVVPVPVRVVLVHVVPGTGVGVAVVRPRRWRRFEGARSASRSRALQ